MAKFHRKKKNFFFLQEWFFPGNPKVSSISLNFIKILGKKSIFLILTSQLATKLTKNFLDDPTYCYENSKIKNYFQKVCKIRICSHFFFTFRSFKLGVHELLSVSELLGSRKKVLRLKCIWFRYNNIPNGSTNLYFLKLSGHTACKVNVKKLYKKSLLFTVHICLN